MYEVGEEVEYEGEAERLGKPVSVSGRFVVVGRGDGFAVLEDARYADSFHGNEGQTRDLHRYRVTV